MTINFATVADVEARLRRTLAEDEVDQCQEFLGDASDLIRAASGRDWLNDDGDALEGTDAQLTALGRVAAAATARVMRNPGGANQRTAGAFSESYAPQSVSTSVYLTKSERAVVAWAAGRVGLKTLGTTRGELETADVLAPPTIEAADDWLVIR